jgi:hypothetical protein
VNRNLTVIVVMALAGCGASGPEKSTDGPVDRPADMIASGAPDGAGGHAGDAGAADAQRTPPDDVTFPPPPVVTCGADAGDGGGACDLPPSSCADPTCADASASCDPWSWVVYYDNPRCVNGRCVWDRAYFQCASFDRCSHGGCVPNFTALP